MTDKKIEIPTEYMQGLRKACENAHSVGFDGCHKIYIAMDREATDDLCTWDYEPTIGTPDELMQVVAGWYRVSCGLRFINVIFNDPTPTNPHAAGIATIVPQGVTDND